MLSVIVGACSSAGAPKIALPGQVETASTSTPSQTPAASPTTPVETTAIASGEPTAIYTLLASGIHACWFGNGGPLRGTYVFRADAQPPSKGGQAEIILYERDVAQADQRGLQAYRISLETAVGGTKITMTALKLPPGFGEPMAEDVKAWAKGGSGCQLRVAFPQPEEKPLQPAKVVKPAAKAKR